MKIFLDRCISPRIGQALRLLGCQWEVLVHDDFFATNTPDPEWIAGVAAMEGPIVILSGDVRISRSKEPKAAWQESGLTAFFFTGKWAQKHLPEQAKDVLRFLPDIKRETRESPTGSGFLLNPNGSGSCKKIYDPGA